MRYFVLALIAATLSFGACKSKKETVKDTASTEQSSEEITEAPVEMPPASYGDPNDSLFASIERTPCFGTCPIYKMEIYDSGYTEYYGKRFVDNVGRYYAIVDKDKLQAIKDRAIEIGYFDFKDEYPSQIADFPSTITTVKIDGKRKRIFNKQHAPMELNKFQSYIDTLYKDVKWIALPEVEEK